MDGVFRFITMTLIAAIIAGPRPSSAYPKKFKRYLPADFILTAVKTLRNKTLRTAPSVTFMSGQSYTSNGFHIANQVKFISNTQIDFWYMKQTIVVPSKAPPRYKNLKPSHLAILVDKTQVPKKAYFLQLSPDLSRPVRVTASCLTCHSNGPRALRPLKKWPLSAESLEQTYDWNEIISDYGVIDNYKPWVQTLTSVGAKGTKKEAPLFYPGRFANQKFEHPRCIECHGKNSGVRSPLTRQNGDSIIALIENTGDKEGFYTPVKNQEMGFMPLFGKALTEADIKCIKYWINNPGNEMGPACNDKGEAK